MLDKIDPASLPDHPPVSTLSRSDVASFDDIDEQAVHIFNECVQRGRIPRVGWSSIGMWPDITPSMGGILISRI